MNIKWTEEEKQQAEVWGKLHDALQEIIADESFGKDFFKRSCQKYWDACGVDARSAESKANEQRPAYSDGQIPVLFPGENGSANVRSRGDFISHLLRKDGIKVNVWMKHPKAMQKIIDFHSETGIVPVDLVSYT